MKGVRFFSCPYNNGLFLSLASVAKQPEWLKLQYCPKRNTFSCIDGRQNDQDITLVPAKQDHSHVSALPNVGISITNIDTNQLPNGTRVVMTSKNGEHIKGTVRWAGHLSLENALPMEEKIPVYGIETVSLYLINRL